MVISTNDCALAIEPLRLQHIPPDLDIQKHFCFVQSVVRLVELSVAATLGDPHTRATVINNHLNIDIDFRFMCGSESDVRSTVQKLLPSQLTCTRLTQAVVNNEIRWMCNIRTKTRPLVDVREVTHVSVKRDQAQILVQKEDLKPTDHVLKVFSNNKDCTRRLFKGTRAPKGLLFASLQHFKTKPKPSSLQKPMVFVPSSKSDHRVPAPSTANKPTERDTEETAIKAGCTVYSALEERYKLSKLTSSNDTLELVVDYLACEPYLRKREEGCKMRSSFPLPELSIRNVPYDMLKLKLKLLQLPVEHAALRNLLDRAVEDTDLTTSIISTRTRTIMNGITSGRY